eukprot:TRINITY_DN6613_c0_g1_i1.p1 TRINITY_DN6613_c0_g1~~TRINITY_DN6613_c0_g1_i1.p1  ORF type:complete len:238 (+),score=71.23 TRINITY_DN6613_c0_g1_i1:39-716(+)
MESPIKKQKTNHQGAIIHTIFSAGSRPVQLVHELGLENEIEIVMLDKIEQSRSEEHLKLNPNGRVPVYFEGERSNPTFVLVESVAIVLYLLEKYDKDHKLMLPADADPHKRGKMWQFLTYSPSELYRLSAELDEAKKVPEDKRDNALIEKLNKRFKTEFGPFLEKELGEKKYLLGDEYTVADLVISYDLLGLKWFGAFDGAEFPKLEAYYNRLADRPAFKATYPM